MNQKASYQMFHGKRPPKKKTINFHVPKNLVKLGKAIAIEYECSKWNGGGDGTKAIYRHEFETPVYLYMDEKQGGQLYIKGNQLIVTDRGIEK